MDHPAYITRYVFLYNTGGVPEASGGAHQPSEEEGGDGQAASQQQHLQVSQESEYLVCFTNFVFDSWWHYWRKKDK